MISKDALRPSGPLWVAVGAGISGLSTYALLAAVAQGVGPSRFDSFSLYWAVLIVISVGGYLPLEQIVARHRAADASPALLRRWAVRWGLATAVVGTVALQGTSMVAGAGRISPLLVLLFAVNLAAVAVQAILRGLAAGSRRLDVYALVVSCDSGVRTVACIVLAVVGVHSLEAYALAIGAGCWISVSLGRHLLRHDLGTGATAPSGGTLRLSGEAFSLVPAMLSMQLLLNSAIFVAFFAETQGTSAGALLAIASLARTSVFVAQAAQAAYVAPIAALSHRGSPQAARASLLVLGLAVVLACATVLGAWALGPWLVQALYGDSFVVSHGLCLAVGAGVGLYLLATVANDLTVARGTHQGAGAHWALGVAAAAVTAIVVADGDARILAPIMVGSSLALVLIAARGRPLSRSSE